MSRRRPTPGDLPPESEWPCWFEEVEREDRPVLYIAWSRHVQGMSGEGPTKAEAVQALLDRLTEGGWA